MKKHWLPQSPLSKSLLAIFLVTLILHTFILVSHLVEHHSNRHEMQHHRITTRLMVLLRLYEKNIGSPNNSTILALQDNALQTSITQKPQWSKRLPDATYWEIRRWVNQIGDESYVSIPLSTQRWLNVQVQLDQGFWQEEFYLILLEAVILIIVLTYLWSTQRFTHPLHEFQQLAHQLGVDIQAPATLPAIKGPPILQETAQALLLMQQRIQELLKDRAQMLAAISHDLRTPLTRLKLRSHFLENEEIKNKNVQDIDEIDAMISDILAYARHDYQQEKLVTVEIVSFLETICCDYQEMQRKVNLEKPTFTAYIAARPRALKRALNNLLQNAMKYGQVATVRATLHPENIEIIIDDKGPGIPEHEQTHVFTAFYRGDPARGSQLPGSGLGLTIARDAIQAQGGTITLLNRPEGGLRVTVTLVRLQGIEDDLSTHS